MSRRIALFINVPEEDGLRLDLDRVREIESRIPCCWCRYGCRVDLRTYRVLVGNPAIYDLVDRSGEVIKRNEEIPEPFGRLWIILVFECLYTGEV